MKFGIIFAALNQSFFLVFSETGQEKRVESNLGIHSNKDALLYA